MNQKRIMSLSLKKSMNKSMSKNKLLIMTGLLISLSLNLSAADQVDLKRCSLVDSDLKRLACYDNMAKGLPSDLVVPAQKNASTSTQNTNIQSTKTKESFGLNVKDTFGMERQLAKTGPKEVVSTIVGEFNGWKGKTVFTLANGQVWKQSNSGSVVFHATDPEVVISKGMFGAYKLKVVGLNKTITVRRIK